MGSTSIFRCHFLLVIGLFLGGHSIAEDRARNVLSDRYAINQTFDRQSFSKDNNVWVYTQMFADTFGMPPENIFELKGIEAAAFRVEDQGYQLCGLGGKAENCKEEYRCMTDVYVNEKEFPLPWATDNQADWFADYSSLNWLKTPIEKGRTPAAPKGVFPVIRGVASLHPFADPESKREANYFQNGDAPGDGDLVYNLVPVYGYKRLAIAGLSMISLSYRCDRRNSQKQSVIFRLESRAAIKGDVLKRFHEFHLPEVFQKKIDDRLQVRHERDRTYYKSLLNLK